MKKGLVIFSEAHLEIQKTIKTNIHFKFLVKLSVHV